MYLPNAIFISDMNTYSYLLYFHSYWRYIALALLVAAIVMAWRGWLGKSEYSAKDEKVALFAMISMHIQFLVGIVLYFISPFVRFDGMKATMGDAVIRFWTVEHLSLMLIALILITLGRSAAKKLEESIAKHKKIAIFFTIALLLILVSIPWPFSQIARPFFR